MLLSILSRVLESSPPPLSLSYPISSTTLLISMTIMLTNSEFTSEAFLGFKLLTCYLHKDVSQTPEVQHAQFKRAQHITCSHHPLGLPLCPYTLLALPRSEVHTRVHYWRRIFLWSEQMYNDISTMMASCKVVSLP